MITLEPDILECKVKWALGSITTNKANRGDGISSWAVSNPKRWCCECAALNMPANLENPAVAIGLEKVSFHSIPKERQCQRMFWPPHIKSTSTNGTVVPECLLNISGRLQAPKRTRKISSQLDRKRKTGIKKWTSFSGRKLKVRRDFPNQKHPHPHGGEISWDRKGYSGDWRRT